MRDLLAAGRFAEAERDGRRRLAETPADDAATMLLGVAVLRQGRPAAAAALFRQAACLRGSDPQPLINQGVALREAGQGQAAEAAYHRALACAPDHPDACFNLANLHKERGDGAKALEFYDRACRLAPERAEFHYNRANLLAGCDRLEEAVAAFAAAGRQRGTTEILVNAGMALKRLGQVGAALDCFERAVAQAPDDVGAHWNRGLTRLLLGDLAGGWADYEWRWRLPDAPRLRFRQPVWAGASCAPIATTGGEAAGAPCAPIATTGGEAAGASCAPITTTGGDAGATLLLHGEQGQGDTIHGARYVPLVRARVGTVVLACAGSLLALMRASFPEVTVVDLGGPLPPFDLHLPMMSLPLAFHTGADTIPARVPYLTAPARARPPLIDRSGGLTHVGVAWRGSAGHEGDSVRSVPLAALAPLREVAGIRLYSLQKGPDEGAFHGPARHGPIIDLAPFITDFADTAGWIGDLDLVVSVDTAVAHLAGALGRPVWIMLASVPDWRWQLDRTDSPWYPSATLFRQDRRGDWTTVVGTIAEALRRSVSA